MNLNFRTLNADEIDVRIGQTNDFGLSLLLYKNSRIDMTLLDEVVGSTNWKREHSRDNANCMVSIWDAEKAQWVGKEDVGTESNTEAEKGLASDSFKRACVNWGIGRELYTSPRINVKWDKVNAKDRNGKKVTYDTFSVDEIEYDEKRRVKRLKITDDYNGIVVFDWYSGEKMPEKQQKTPEKPLEGVWVNNKPSEKKPQENGEKRTNSQHLKLWAEANNKPVEFVSDAIEYLYKGTVIKHKKADDMDDKEFDLLMKLLHERVAL